MRGVLAGVNASAAVLNFGAYLQSPDPWVGSLLLAALSTFVAVWLAVKD